MAVDLDGTLLDARPRQVGVAVEAFAGFADGRRLDGDRFWQLKRDGATTREALLRMGESEPFAGAVAERWAERIEAPEWVVRDRALDGVAAVLRALRAAAGPVTVITARRSPEGAAASLDAAGLGELVDELVVVDPRRAVEAKAAALRERSAGLYVGDTESDGAAAALAGVRFAAVDTGQRSGAFLRGRGLLVRGSLGEALGLR